MNQKDYFGAKLQYEVDACDLNKLVKEEGSIYEIVDARSQRAYNIEHIQGALSLPYALMNEENVQDLDRDKIYVTYCDGFGCNASTKGAYMLSKLGFKVKELIGGIEAWKYEGHKTVTNLTREEYQEELACGPTCSCHN